MLNYRLLLPLTAIALALFPVGAYSESKIPTPQQMSVDELQQFLPKLKRGGYALYFRHMTTDHAHEDKRPVDLSDCRTQRNLSAKGRQQAAAIGKAFHKLQLPISEVISSPFCRCKDTAQLMFGHYTISDKLYFAMGLSRQGKMAKGKAMRAFLNKVPVAGKNLIIVSHSANLQEAFGIWPKPEGSAYIFRHNAKGQLKAIGKVNPDTWSKLR